jgi:N utilization substance protein B
MGTRRKSRELVMQMLFQGDLGKQTPEEVESLFWESRDDVDEETRGFADDLYRIATAREDEVDALIVKHAKNWRMERMPVVDRNLLRAGVAELLGYPKTPAAVVINETLEVAKRYAAPDSMPFLNGVLDAVAQELMAERLKVGIRDRD